MDLEYLKEFTEENGYELSARGRRDLPELVMVIENEQNPDRRSWQGGAFTVAKPWLILHYAHPDKELSIWAKALDVPIRSCDMTNDERQSLQEALGATARKFVPVMPARAVYEDLVMPIRARYMGIAMQTACRQQREHDKIVAAIIPEKYALPALFEELDQPSDESRSIAYVVINELSRARRNALHVSK